jgi:YhcH/YjgK/YiaL family protein
MIYDHIKNIGLYKGLTPALDVALNYIANVSADVEVGTHLLENGVKAVVSAYETSLVNPKGYEAHRKYADIQLCVMGTELIRCKPLPQVVETIPYDEAKDAARYTDSTRADCPATDNLGAACPGTGFPAADLVIGDGYFLVVFPDDAHEPGLAPGGHCAPVKKVVMKVPVE